MYATVADMVARYGEDQLIQLTDRVGGGVIDTAVADQALSDASAVVDGHLAGRYPVPLSTVPAILVGYVCDLARRNLYTDAVPDVVEKRASAAARYLELVGQGRLNLGASPEPGSDNTVQVVTVDRRRNGIGL